MAYKIETPNHPATTAEQISKLVTKAATSRILETSVKNIKSLRVNGEIVTVELTAGKVELNMQRYRQVYVTFRQEAARQLVAVQVAPTKYVTYNPKDDSSRVVTVNGTTVQCQCDDYAWSSWVFGKASCKHLYSVLGLLGHSSLDSYLQSQQPPLLVVESTTRSLPQAS